MLPESLLDDKEPIVAAVSSVLIVDDSIEDSLAISRLLRQGRNGSVRVFTAINMLDALREFRHERPDCVLIDHRLADGEGIELLHMLSEVTAPLPPPVIYLANEDSPRLAVRALKAGALDYLAKSWLDAESLRRAVDRAVERVAVAKTRYQRHRQTEDRNRDLQNRVQTLQQSEKIKGQITGLAPTFLYVYDVVEDQLIYTNNTMLQTLGYSEVEMLDMGRGGLLRLVHPDDQKLYLAHLPGFSALRDGDVVENDVRLQQKNGNWIWLHLREAVFLRDKNGAVWQIIGSAEDVTQERESRHSLESKTSDLEIELNELKSVWDQSVIGIAVTVKGRPNMLKLNSVLARLLDLGEETNLSDFSKVFGFTSSSSPFGKALNRGIPTRNASRTVHKADGNIVHLLETIHPLLDMDGIITGCIAYFIPTMDGETSSISQDEQDGVWHAKLTQLQTKLEQAEVQRIRAQDQLEVTERISSERQFAVAELEARMASLRSQVDSHSNDAAKSDTRLATAIARAKDAEAKFADVEQKWKSSQSALKASETGKNELSAQIKTLQFDAEKSRTELRLRIEEVATLRQEASEAEVRFKDKASQLAEIQLALAVAAKTAEEADFRANANLAIVNDLRTEIEILTAQIAAGQKEILRANQLEIELKETRADLERLDGERESVAESLRLLKVELDNRLREQEASRGELYSKSDESRELILQIDNLKSNLRQTEAERDRLAEIEKRLTKEIDSIKGQLGDSLTAQKDLDKQISILRLELDANQTAAKSLDQDLSGTRDLLAQSEEVRNEQAGRVSELELLVANLEKSTAESEQIRSKLQLEIDGLKDDDTSYDEKLRQAEFRSFELQSELETAVEKLERTAQALLIESAAIVRMKEEISALEELAAQQKLRLETVSQDNVLLNQKLLESQELSARNADAYQELSRASNRSGELLAQARAGREESEKALAGMEGELRSERDRYNRSQEVVHRLQFDLEQKDREIARVQSNVREKDESVEKLQRQLVAAKKQALDAEAWLTEWKEAAPDFEKQLEEAVENLAQAQEEITSRLGQITDLQSQLALSIEEKRELDERFNQITSEYQDAKDDRAKLQDELAQITESEHAAKDELATKEAKLLSLRNELTDTVNRLKEARLETASLRSLLDTKGIEVDEKLAEIQRIENELVRSEQARKQAQDRFIENENKLLRVQQNLRNTEEKYRSLAAKVPGIVFTTNSIGIIDFVNERWESYTGESMQTSWGNDWREVVYKGDLDAFSSTWISGIKEGTAFSIQFRLRRSDNQYRWHELHHTPEIEDGRVQRWVGTITEIHEQVISREAARQSRLRYGALLDSTSEAVLFLSPSGNVLGASKSSLILLRQGGEGVVGQPMWDTKWWPKSEHETLEDAIRRGAAGEKVSVETARIDKDGQSKAVSLTINPVPDENEQVTILLAYFQDR